MKNHVWRPLFVVIGLVIVILLFRAVYVPEDFGSHEQGYTFGYHRLSNEQEWREFPAKYQDSSYCSGCHADKTTAVEAAHHAMIPCENCHGAAFDHPEEPPRLTLDRSRDLCLRCHAALFMPTSGRSAIPGIEPAGHNPGFLCVDCHDAHNPSLEEM